MCTRLLLSHFTSSRSPNIAQVEQVRVPTRNIKLKLPMNAVATVTTKDNWDFHPYMLEQRARNAPQRYILGCIRWREGESAPQNSRIPDEARTGYYAETSDAQRYHAVAFNHEHCCWVELRWSARNNYWQAFQPAPSTLNCDIPI